MADYVMREMNDMRGSGDTVFYPQIERYRMFSEEEFINKMAMEGSGLTVGQVESVLTALKSRMAEMLAMGYSVKVKGVGTFSASLGVKKGKERETEDENEAKRNAQSIVVKNIRFKADNDLVAETNMRCRLERKGVRRIKKVDSTEAERLEMAMAFLKNNPVMHIVDYMRITGLTRTLASEELRRLRSDETSGIGTIGTGSHKAYVLK